MERNKPFERLRRHTIAAPHIMKAVAGITKRLGAYLAVHIRVGDFRTWCKSSGGVSHPTGPRDTGLAPFWEPKQQELGTLVAHRAHWGPLPPKPPSTPWSRLRG